MRIAESDWAHLGKHFGRRDVESAAILLCEPLPCNGGMLLLARRLLPIPDDGYIIRRIDQLRIDPVTLNRLVRPARDAGWSIFTIHSHPNSLCPAFSLADDHGDARLLPSFRHQIPRLPHGSLVWTPNGETVGRWLTPQGVLADLGVRVVGRVINFGRPPETEQVEQAFARQRLALGASGQAVLRQLRVGIVGLGGIGSFVSLILAHLGVGELVLVDGDHLEPSNVSRIPSALAGKIGLQKVKLAADHARERGVTVREVPEFLYEEAQLKEIRGCDVVLSCVDRHRPRARLNRFSYRSLVPVIDMGTAFRVDEAGAMIGDSGRVVIVGPGRPCLACWGHLNPERLREEALTAEERADLEDQGYLQGGQEEQPSVIAFNAQVAAAGVVELLRLATGFAGQTNPPQRLAFSFSAGTVRRNRLGGERICAICRPAAIRTAI